MLHGPPDCGRGVGGPDGFDVRCTNMTVRVPQQGQAQVQWDVLETFMDGGVTVRLQQPDGATP